MSLGSVLKGPRFHRMESAKLMQYRSNLDLQYSVYLPYVSFLAGLSVSSVLVTFAVAIAVVIAFYAVVVGAAAVVCLYFFMVSVANREATEIHATWVV